MTFDMIPVLVAVLLVILTALILKTVFGRTKGNNVILMGIEGSGKSNK